jgi:transcriptional regulator with XRE-family HTH domain
MYIKIWERKMNAEIKRLRKQVEELLSYGLTQKRIAARSDICTKTVSRFLKGKSPSLKTFLALQEIAEENKKNGDL